MTRVAARPAVLARGTGNVRNRKTVPPVAKVPQPSWFDRFKKASDPRTWPRVVGNVDGVLFGTVVALIVFGVVMVYSASSVRAQREFHDGQHYLFRQAIYALVGIPILMALSRLDYHRYRMLGKPLLFIAACLMAFVIGGFGHAAGGAARWIPIGPVHVQPAEVAKIALIIWLADSLAEKDKRVGSFWVGFLPHVLVASGLIALCMAQPDFGSGVMMMLLTFVLLFAAGAQIGYMILGGAIVLPVAWWLVKSSPYRMARWEAFTDPLKHRMDGGYQIVESWMSFGNGGLWGVGLGNSQQKLLYLPEAHTDFIAAIVAEELGFIGFAALVLAFMLVIARGVRASLRAVDHFGTYLGIGFTMFVGAQAITNLAVVLGLVPTKGLTLPFLSSGGSSLLVNCAAVGILLNVSRPRRFGVGEASPVVGVGVGARAASGGEAARELASEGGTL
ncbi:MAG TPA: putative lipid II flippase FtsW [Polyangiales bacterium]|nr:putative lipid II flippase FtsW [Polyangiales bacterium]